MLNSRMRLRLWLVAALLGANAAFAEEPTSKVVGHIDRLDPALDRLVAPEARMQVIGTGYSWSEGPVWVRSGGFLLFSDIPNNAIIRWDAKHGARTYLKPAGYTGDDPRGGELGSNGLAIDPQGRLVLCQHGDRRIARLDSPLEEPMAKYSTLVDRFEGKRLNSPNDLVFDSHGMLYFTDPPYGLSRELPSGQPELEFNGVYRLDPKGKLTLLTKELERPNGIALSPDEKTLYVSNSHQPRLRIMAYPLEKDGTLGTGRVFFDAQNLAGKQPGSCDGLTVDHAGNLFATMPGGVGVFAPDGKQLGLLATGDRTANVRFGEEGATLFICANHNLLRIETRTKGLGFE